MWKSHLFPTDGPHDWSFFESVEVLPGESVTVVREAEPDQPPFLVGTLMVPRDVAPHWLLDSLVIGYREQLAVPDAGVPMVLFDDRQPFSLLRRDPLLIVPRIMGGSRVTLRLRNINANNQKWSGKFVGWYDVPNPNARFVKE